RATTETTTIRVVTPLTHSEARDGARCLGWTAPTAAGRTPRRPRVNRYRVTMLWKASMQANMLVTTSTWTMSPTIGAAICPASATITPSGSSTDTATARPSPRPEITSHAETVYSTPIRITAMYVARGTVRSGSL